MLQSESNWRFIETETIFNDEITGNAQNISPVIKELLLQRGITSIKEAGEFLNPQLKYLHNPLLIHSMKKAVERINQAIESGEKILVYGDYDADGVTSTTLLLKTLKELNASCDFYIPNRFTEGYGPNEAAFKWAKSAGFDLIITVDSGIAAINEAKVAKGLDIDLIITDHHEIQEEIPEAYAVIHPKCSPEYPFKELAGVGVAFKLAECLLGYFPEHLLDLVAIGTVADMVPLVNENRVLVYYGLEQLTKTNRAGLVALKQQCNLDGRVSEEDIGFLIGPRLNAVGRLQDADLAVDLLMTEDREEALLLAEDVQQINKERQQIVSNIAKEAEKMVEPGQDVIVVAKEGWNVGVLGIVASRLVKKFNRPAIVMALNEDTSSAKGSARSIPNFNLFENCMAVKDLFTHFGGHSQAAGLSLPIENIRSLSESLNRLIREQLKSEDYKPILEVNKQLNIPEVNEALVEEIDQLAPFGMANPKPLFCIKSKAKDIRQLGHLKNHLKIQFKYENYLLEGIGFGLGELYAHISETASISVVGELNINEWNGNRKPQVVIKDLQIDDWQIFDHRGKRNTDLAPYFERNNRNVIISNQPIDIPETNTDLEQINYLTNIQDINQTDALYLFDLPPDMSNLKQIIEHLKPTQIHLCFYIEKSTYLATFPSRDDFKWLYAQLMKRKSIDLNNELQLIMDTKGWTKENIIFMSKVFLELKFVNIDKGVLTLNPTPQKNDLKASTLYQNRLNQADMEKQLYYSTIDELHRLFASFMSLETTKEEVVNGL
ncbi:single-stranded-DNA-specific exonuclease RecJ [Virgibacillus sp. MSJ-26]|uniref:single-stranded-DNA-specific exonuclease RecJ n=1 Tax=Virgibacillus sp. MSJ-26 TaxID=2841522 RepID=UPI001C0FE665|nr:single-stranded-DNA-specific exonuclease RecJ [Virgibacillus sp. MSJ-26]MBU5466500.1 single-stranded-DNA-specific exonuclease RecJ [Virgibacillus sp. MSJ-26]